MQVLEFLAWKTRDNPDYQKHLDKMLEHCSWPPRFDKSSEIWGSVRPKIYSIRQILISNSEIYDKVREHYKILLGNLPIEDLITYCIIDEYLHLIQGQIWAEVLRYLKQIGVNPLGSDDDIVYVV